MVKKLKLSCVFLSETKGGVGVDRVARKLGFEKWEGVEANGRSGSLIWLWKEEIEIKIEWKLENVICSTIKDYNQKDLWRLYATYGSTRYGDKLSFWGELTAWVEDEKLPWMMLGDLNEITEESENFQGRGLRGRHLFLKDFVQQTGAIDLGFVGRRFTWINKQEGSVSIRKRLDRAISYSGWLELFPKATVQHLNMEYSDHLPILLKTNGEEVTYNLPFRFIQA